MSTTTTTTTALEIAKGKLSSAAIALKQAGFVSTHMQRALTRRTELLGALIPEASHEVIARTMDQISTTIKVAADMDHEDYVDVLNLHDKARRVYIKAAEAAEAALARDAEALKLKLKRKAEAEAVEADAGVAVKKGRA